MKWVYMALINGKVSAFHKKEKIIKDYLRRYKDSNPIDECYIAKTRKDSVKNTRDYEDLYLIEVYDDLFIQSKYADAYSVFFIDDETSDVLSMKSNLIDQLTTGSCSKKQYHSIMNALEEVTSMENSEGFYFIPQLSTLQEACMQLECYREKTFGG